MSRVIRASLSLKTIKMATQIMEEQEATTLLIL